METIQNTCKNYLNGLQDLMHLNVRLDSPLSIIQTISYFTVVISLTFGAVFAFATLAERVKKHITDHQEKAHFIAMKILADKNDPIAQQEVGRLYQFGIGTRQDLNQASEYMYRANEQIEERAELLDLQIKADNGDAEAQCAVGAAYLQGVHVSYDPVLAFIYIQKAADQGIVLARTLMEASQLFGKGVDSDRETYRNILTKYFKAKSDAVSIWKNDSFRQNLATASNILSSKLANTIRDNVNALRKIGVPQMGQPNNSSGAVSATSADASRENF